MKFSLFDAPLKFSRSFAYFLVGAALLCFVAATQARFVAYLDFSPGTNGNGIGTHSNTLRFLTPHHSGFLTNAADGITTPVFVSSSTNGNVTSGNTAAEPAAGTPAYQTFNGYVYFGTGPLALLQVPTNVSQTYTFSNLNPNARYTFKGSAVRGGPAGSNYTNRWTKVSLVGAASFTPNHTPNAVTSAQEPADLLPNEVALNLGINNLANQGDMAVWENIDPGPDGVIQVVSTRYAGALPPPLSATANNPPYGYAITGIKLQEGSDISSFILAKGAEYSQTDPGPPALDNSPFLFRASVNTFEDGTLIAAGIELPNESSQGLTNSYPDGADFFKSFSTQQALDSGYPNTYYGFNISTVNDGDQFSSLQITGNAYPNAPHISNFSSLHSIDPNSSFTISWDPFTGGTASDFIGIKIYAGTNEDTGDTVFKTSELGQPGALTGTATSVLIPPGTLTGGGPYIGRLIFAKVVDSTTTAAGATGISAYYAKTVFPISLVSTSAFQVLHAFADFPSDGNRPYAGLMQAVNGDLYGTAGGIFRISPDGSSYTFASMDGPADGPAFPTAPFIEMGGLLWSASQYGGSIGRGAIYTVTTNSLSITPVASFTTNGNGGVEPGEGALLYLGGTNFMGTTLYGGNSDNGTVFELLGGTTMTNRFSFNGLDGHHLRSQTSEKSSSLPMGPF